MRHLKAFESDEFKISGEEIVNIFTDFEDEGFDVTVKFGKRLHSFYDMSSSISTEDINLGFRLSIWVYLHSNDINVQNFMRTDNYLELINNVQFRLSCENLYIRDIETVENRIIIIIYNK